MAQFYARDRGYSDFHLELPIEKMAQKELKKGTDKIEQIRATAALVKSQKAAQISALNKKYKIQSENLRENHKLTQANYKLIHEREQLNAQREFENLQRSNGNPGPKQAQGFGSLIEMAPALAQMVGEYVEKEKVHKNKTVSNEVLELGLTGAQAEVWYQNRSMIAANTFEAQMYAKAESEKLGVEVTPEQMLAIVDLYGERNLTAMTALAHNSAERYSSFLLGADDTEIVLDGGVTKTWGEIRRSRNTAEFESGLRQMRGHFTDKHQISITDQVPGILDSIGKHIRQVESQERGRFHNAVRQKDADTYAIHEDTEFYNALYEGSHSVLKLQNKLAYLRSDQTGKPNHNVAFDEVHTRFKEGIADGTVNSQHIQDYIELASRQPQGWSPWRQNMMEQLLEESRNADVTKLQNTQARKDFAQGQAVREAVEQYWHPTEGWNGRLPMSQQEFSNKLAESGLTRQSIAQVFSQTISSSAAVSQSPEEKYGLHYKKGLDALLHDGPDLSGQDIVMKDSETWTTFKNHDLLEARLKIRYANEFNELVRRHGASNLDGIAIMAKKNTLDWLAENPTWYQLSPAKKTNKDGEEINVPNKDRSFSHFNDDVALPNTKIKAMASLDDYPGVSYKERVLGVETSGYEPVVADEVINSYYINGRPQVQSFVDSSIGRALQEATGLPASLIFAIHAEKLGKPLQDEEYIDLEEYNSLPEGVKRVLIHNSSQSGQVIQSALAPQEQRQFASYGIGGPSLNPGFHRTNAVLEPNEDAPYNLMGGTPNARAHLAAINLGESGGPSKHIKLVGGELVPELLDMSIQEVYNMAYYNPDGSKSRIGTGTTPSGKKVKYGADSHAAGAYQFHPDTMLEAAKYAGIPLNTKFTYRTQQLLALAWAKKLGANLDDGPTYENYRILGSSGGWEAVGKMTYQEYVNHFNRFRQNSVHPSFSDLRGGALEV